jgi:gallate dioxygenase
MWLAMRGALSPRVKKIHQNYYLPMTTAMAVAVFEETGAKAKNGKRAHRRAA